MFFEVTGELFRTVLKLDQGIWAICFEDPAAPIYISNEQLNQYPRVPAPEEYIMNVRAEDVMTGFQERRKTLIAPLLEDPIYITDRAERKRKAEEIAGTYKTTSKRVLRLFYQYLARRSLSIRKPRRKLEQDKYRNYIWAIETFYYSAKRISLPMAYDLMLTSRYMTPDGTLMDDHPSWESFRHFYYDKGYHKKLKKSISRDGLSNYQRNNRPIYGSAMGWKDKIGAFQMDATEADIYLVSRFDRACVIGRPNIYLAVDTATQLIAGIYVGLDAGETAVMACLANAASDKVAYCKSLGIDIEPEQWPNKGLPGEIITDKGREFIGSRVGELCMIYGLERESLPPFRPDAKGLVEKSFDVLQQKYKPLLRGKGIIESDSQERWAVDYRAQASLNLTEFTKIVIHCVIYFNAHRVLKNYIPSAEMAADGVNPIAADLWRWYEAMGRSSMIPVDEREIYLLTLLRKNAKFSRRGISFNGLWYINEDYKKYWQEADSDKTVIIAYDNEKTDCIYLVREGEYIPFTLAPYFSNYAGLTQKEFEMFRDRNNRKKRELAQQDTEARVAVLQSIQSITSQIDTVEKEKPKGDEIRQNREAERGKLT